MDKSVGLVFGGSVLNLGGLSWLVSLHNVEGGGGRLEVNGQWQVTSFDFDNLWLGSFLGHVHMANFDGVGRLDCSGDWTTTETRNEASITVATTGTATVAATATRGTAVTRTASATTTVATSGSDDKQATHKDELLHK